MNVILLLNLGMFKLHSLHMQHLSAFILIQSHSLKPCILYIVHVTDHKRCHLCHKRAGMHSICAPGDSSVSCMERRGYYEEKKNELTESDEIGYVKQR